jgi:HSP20 family protein
MDELTQVPSKRTTAELTRPALHVLSSLQREVDRLFDEFARSRWPRLGLAGATVTIDMAETKDAIEISAELPGLQDKDVKVSLSDRTLTISGEKQSEREEKDKSYHYVERTFGSFSRSIELPSDVQADKITAVMSNGVLKITAPLTARPEPKTIEVKAA